MEEEIILNTAMLLNPWQPHKGMEILIDQFNQIQIYELFARNQMDDKILMNYFLVVIKKTGKYTWVYEDWLVKDGVNKNYAYLKEF